MADISLVIDVKQNGVTSAVKNTKALEGNVKLLSNSFKNGSLSQRQYYKGLLELAQASGKSEAELRKYANELRKIERASAAAAAATRAETKAIRDYANARRQANEENRRRIAEEKAAAAAARASADANRRLRMEFKEGYAAQVALRAAQMRLNQARRQGIITDEEYRRQLDRLGDSAQNSTRHMSRAGVAMQQTGYQVGDFLVQIQSGTNPMVAFGQQATQLVGVLYMLPAATLAASVPILGLSVSVGVLIASLGIIIPLATALGAAFMRTRKATEETVDGFVKFSSSVDTAKEKLAEMNQELALSRSGLQDLEEFALSTKVRQATQDVLALESEILNLSGRNKRAAELRLATARNRLQTERDILQEYRDARDTLAEIKRGQEVLNTGAQSFLNIWTNIVSKIKEAVSNLPVDAGGYSGRGTSAGAGSTQVERILMGMGGEVVPPETETGSSGGGGGVAQQDQRLESFIASIQTEREALSSWYMEQNDLLAQFNESELAVVGGHAEAKLRLEREYSNKLVQLKQSESALVQNSAKGMYSELSGLLNMFAGKSKAAAIASIALTKGLRIAEVIASGAAAQVRALAELGPILGPPAAAKIAGFTKIQAGIIAATGLAQAASVGSGSSASLSGSTASGADAAIPTQGTATPQRVIIEGIDRDSLITGEQLSNIFEALYKENENRGFVFEVAR